METRKPVIDVESMLKNAAMKKVSRKLIYPLNVIDNWLENTERLKYGPVWPEMSEIVMPIIGKLRI